MLNLLIKSSVRRKIIGLSCLNSSLEIYPRQVVREIGESPYLVGLELSSLAKSGLLLQRREGNRKYYRWRSEHPLAPELKALFEKARESGDKELRKLPDLRRRKAIERNLKKVLEGLKKYYDPEKVIVFGSAATGKVGPYSDIDLVIIKKTDLPYFERVEQLVNLLDYDVDIDFLIYTPWEFEKAVQERRFFQEEIVKKGEILYEKVA